MYSMYSTTIFYETSSYEPHEPDSCFSTREKVYPRPDSCFVLFYPNQVYPRPDSCFSTLFSPTRIEFLKTDLCVLRSIRVSEQSGTATGMQTTRENIYRFLLRSIRVSIFESTAMN